MICALAELHPILKNISLQKSCKRSSSKIDFISPFSRETFSLHIEHTFHYTATGGRNFLNRQSNATQSTAAFQSCQFNFSAHIFSFHFHISVKSHFFFFPPYLLPQASLKQTCLQNHSDMMRTAYVRWTQRITGLIVTPGPLDGQAILRYKVTAPTSVVIHIDKITETPEKQYQVLRIQHLYSASKQPHFVYRLTAFADLSSLPPQLPNQVL